MVFNIHLHTYKPVVEALTGETLLQPIDVQCVACSIRLIAGHTVAESPEKTFPPHPQIWQAVSWSTGSSHNKWVGFTLLPLPLHVGSRQAHSEFQSKRRLHTYEVADLQVVRAFAWVSAQIFCPQGSTPLLDATDPAGNFTGSWFKAFLANCKWPIRNPLRLMYVICPLLSRWS